MKHFWTVWKTQFRQTLGLSYLKYLYRTNRSVFWRRLVFFPLIILAVAPAFKLIIDLYNLMFAVLHPLGQDAVMLAMAFLFAQSLSLVFGLFYLLSNFYFARDLDLLVPLPLKPSVILGSKFLNTVISENLVTLPIVIPALFVYSQAAPAPGFWLLAILITLALPVIPLTMASIFVILLMKVTNVRNGRGLMRVFGAFLGVLLFSWVQWMQFRFRNGGPEQLNNLITQPEGLVHLITGKFPPSLWAAQALTQFPGSRGFYFAAMFFAVSAAALAIMFVLANRFFYQGLIGGNEITVQRKKMAASPRMFKAKSPITALFLREWRNLVRSASFLMPVLINIVILPVALLVPLVSGQDNQIFNPAVISQYPWVRQIIILVASAAIIFISTANSMASTAISREGKSFWVSKIIPVSAFVQVLSKLALTSLVPVLLIILVLVAETAFLHFNAVELFSQMLLAFTGSLLAMSFGIFLDLLHPKLNWTDPQQVMKRNLNVLISTFSTFGFIGLSGGFIFYVVNNFSLPPGAAPNIFIILYTVLLGLLLWLIRKKADNLYKRIEP